MTKEQVIAAAKSLSADDRVEVMAIVARQMSADERSRIMASIDPTDDEFVLTDELKAELDRRLALIDSGQMPMLTRDQFNARVDALRSADR